MAAHVSLHSTGCDLHRKESNGVSMEMCVILQKTWTGPKKKNGDRGKTDAVFLICSLITTVRKHGAVTGCILKTRGKKQTGREYRDKLWAEESVPASVQKIRTTISFSSLLLSFPVYLRAVKGNVEKSFHRYTIFRNEREKIRRSFRFIGTIQTLTFLY